MIIMLAHIALLAYFTVGLACAATGSISVVHGQGYETGTKNRSTLRLDVTEVGKYGLLYGRFDIVDFNSSGSNLNSRIIGHAGTGWHVAGQMQNQRGISQTNYGFGYSEFGKQQSWFVDLYKINSNYYGDGLSLFGYGSYKFTDKIKADGFIEYTVPEGGSMQPVFLAQPAITYNLFGDLWVGVEQQRYFNKSGIMGLDEVVNQLRLKWEF